MGNACCNLAWATVRYLPCGECCCMHFCPRFYDSYYEKIVPSSYEEQQVGKGGVRSRRKSQDWKSHQNKSHNFYRCSHVRNADNPHHHNCHHSAESDLSGEEECLTRGRRLDKRTAHLLNSAFVKQSIHGSSESELNISSPPSGSYSIRMCKVQPGVCKIRRLGSAADGYVCDDGCSRQKCRVSSPVANKRECTSREDVTMQESRSSNSSFPVSRARNMKRATTVADVSSITEVCRPAEWMRAQSMQDVGDTESEPKKSAEEMARDLGLNLALYQTTGNSASDYMNKSLAIMKAAQTATDFLEPKDQLPDLPFGVVHFTACHYKKTKSLMVHIAKVENLPPRGNRFNYDVVVKLCILPSENKVQCSRVQTGNLNPTVEEDFCFQVKETTGRVLRISVYDADLQGKYDAIGHALFYLEDITATPRRYKMNLYKQREPDVKPGMLHFCLSYKEETRELLVHIIQARRLLLTMHTGKKHTKYVGKYNTYIKANFYCNGDKVKTKTSNTVSNDRDPYYNHTFHFKRPSSFTIGDTYVVVTIKLKKDFVKDKRIGRYIFGPCFNTSENAVTPWGEAVVQGKLTTHWCRLYL